MLASLRPALVSLSELRQEPAATYSINIEA
jgi:hypothetical protein